MAKLRDESNEVYQYMISESFCSITVASYELIRLIRFLSRISTQLSKKYL